MSRPFLLLSSRPEHDVARLEHRSVARLMGLAPADVVQLRMESAPLPPLELDAYSGVLLGGSPFTFSDSDKTDLQQRVEADAGLVLRQVLERDLPFLGLCYGIGLVTDLLGGHQKANRHELNTMADQGAHGLAVLALRLAAGAHHHGN